MANYIIAIAIVLAIAGQPLISSAHTGEHEEPDTASSKAVQTTASNTQKSSGNSEITCSLATKSYVLGKNGTKTPIASPGDFNQVVQDMLSAIPDVVEDLDVEQWSETVIIGPDGKSRTLKQGETINGVLQQMLEGMKLEGVDGAESITEIGPIMLSADHESVSIQKELQSLKKELADQRKLLEQILDKLQ